MIWVHQQRLITEKKDILILGKGPKQGLEHTLSAEKLYWINFTKENAKCCLSLHYNGANSYLFVKGIEIIKFKVKDSEITPYPLQFVIFNPWKSPGTIAYRNTWLGNTIIIFVI